MHEGVGCSGYGMGDGDPIVRRVNAKMTPMPPSTEVYTSALSQLHNGSLYCYSLVAHIFNRIHINFIDFIIGI